MGRHETRSGFRLRATAVATEFLTVDVTPMMELRSRLKANPQFRDVLIAAFEKKFHEKPEGISLDVEGIVLSAVAAGAGTYMRTVADMLLAATEAMNDLNSKVVALLRQFDAEVAEFLGEGVA